MGHALRFYLYARSSHRFLFLDLLSYQISYYVYMKYLKVDLLFAWYLPNQCLNIL